MNHREKTVVYTLLVALLVMNGLLLLSLSGRPAFAQADPQDESAVTDDGATAVESLTLRGEDGESVVLRTEEGRLAWGDAPYERAYSVAYVNIGDALNQLMLSSEFEEEREPLMKELEETEEEYLQRLQEYRERLQSLNPQSEEAQRLSQEGEQVFREYRQWQQEAMDRRGKLDADHLERAYRTLVDAVAIVAERRAIDIVHRFIPTDEPFEAENPEQAMLNIRLRPVLRSPDELDITGAIMEELALD